jgi:hypothetical protein
VSFSRHAVSKRFTAEDGYSVAKGKNLDTLFFIGSKKKNKFVRESVRMVREWWGPVSLVVAKRGSGK